VLARGTTSNGTPRFSDGSGITAFIMAEPYPWGSPVRADDATSFTASLFITVPTLVTITVKAPAAADQESQAVTVTTQRWILPGMDLTDQCAVVVVVPGLLVTWKGLTVTATSATISATVHMMCGCTIDNLFWPAANFEVIAILTPPTGPALPPITLAWTGPSTFSAAAPASGTYTVQVFAVESLNGNTGSAVGSLSVSEPG
jgi:hypothetical protein